MITDCFVYCAKVFYLVATADMSSDLHLESSARTCHRFPAFNQNLSAAIKDALSFKDLLDIAITDCEYQEAVVCVVYQAETRVISALRDCACRSRNPT